MIDERALGIALESLSNCAPKAGFGNLARSLIEAYEAARFGDVELARRPWFVAHLDFHRALGMGKEIDDALWEAIQAFEGQKALEQKDERP